MNVLKIMGASREWSYKYGKGKNQNEPCTVKVLV